MLLIPCRQANRKFERSRKNERPDKHRQNDQKKPENSRKKQATKTQKPSQKRRKETRPKNGPQTGQSDLSYGVQGVGSCDQPSGARRYVIPVTLQIQTRLETHKTQVPKTAKHRKGKPKKTKKTKATKATKSGQNKQKNAPNRKPTKNPPPGKQDRIASSKLRK